MIGGSVSTGFASAAGPGGSAYATGTGTSMQLQNPFVIQATGSRGTSMICHGTAGNGHGTGECRTNGRANYQFMF